MNLDEITARAIELVRREGRVSQTSLKQRLGLADERFAELKRELIQVRRLAIEEDSSVLVWAATAGGGPGALRPTSSLTADGERRRLTVMFCDLVGSTQLSEQVDPEDLALIIQQYRELCGRIVAGLDGYVAQYLGDGVMVYFGYPVAHEDDAQRAVRAALDFIAALQTHNRATPGPALRTRVGIHTGLGVTREISAQARHDSASVIGETPDLAARVQQAAEPDTVVISSATYRLVKGFFACQSLGYERFKGISNPVEIYRVLRESDAESRFEATTGPQLHDFVDRHGELKLIAERWRLAVAGRGQVLAVSGEPGIGKSRLLHEVKRIVAEDDGLRLEFQCSPFHTNSALYPIIQSLHRIFQLRECKSAEEKLARLEAVLETRSFPDADTSSLFAALLSLPTGDQLATLSPQKQKEKTSAALLAWFREESSSKPSCVVMEDLQWADPSTLELLALFIQQVPGLRVLWLLTSRPGFASQWLADLPVSQLTLGRLDDNYGRRVIDEVTGGATLPADVTREILGKADGNPLFLEELTRTVLESGGVKLVDDRYELTGRFSSPAVPASVYDSLMARLDNLKQFKEVAQLGAMLGREFSYDLLAAVSHLDPASLQLALDRLVDAQLLNRTGLESHETYQFKHALIQDAAYESILKSKRQQYHGHIAEVLVRRFPETVQSQPEFVAYHYAEGGLMDDAIGYYQKAAEKAVQRSANLEAISHLRRALELLERTPATPQRAHTELMLQVALGTPLMATKGFASPEAEQAYARARELCMQAGEVPQLFPVLWGLWLFYTARARHLTALELADQCKSIADATGDPALMLEAHHALGVTRLALGDFSRALDHLQQAIAIYDPVKHGPLAFAFGQDCGVVCLSHAAWALWFLGHPEQARQRNREALALAEKSSHPFSVVIASDFAAWLHQIRRDEGAIREHAETAITLSTDLQFAYWMNMGLILRGWALTRQGELEEGLRQMRQGLAGYEATGAEIMKPYLLGLLAEVCERTGQIDEGLRLLADAQEIVERNHERWWEAELYRLRGEFMLSPRGSAALDSGTVATVEGCFRTALEIARRQGAKALELRAAMSLSRLLRRRGATAEARTILEQAYAGFDEGFDTADLQEARMMLDEAGAAR